MSLFDFGSVYGAGLVLGTSAFNYEGVALILPIRSSTPEHIIGLFPNILTITMAIIGIFSNAFAAFIFYSFGDETVSPVTDNILNTRIKLVSLMVYSLAIVFSVPLQLFPAMGIAEKYLSRLKAPSFRREAPSGVLNSEDTSSSLEIQAESNKANPKKLPRELINSLESLSICSTSNSSENVPSIHCRSSPRKTIQLSSIHSGKIEYSPVSKARVDTNYTLDHNEIQQEPTGMVESLAHSIHSLYGDKSVNTERQTKRLSKLNGDEQEEELEQSELRQWQTLKEVSFEVELMKEEDYVEQRRLRHPVYRTLTAYSLVLFCGVMAYLFEDELGGFVTIIGGLLCVPLAFVYPPLFYLQLNRDRISKLEKISILILVATGSLVSFSSVTMAILNWEASPRSLACIL